MTYPRDICISLRIISIHSKFAMKIRNGGGVFFCTPRLCRRSVTSSTCTSFIWGGIILQQVVLFATLCIQTLVFLVSARSFVRLTKENYNCATGCCINFLEKFMQTFATIFIYWLFLVTKLGSKRVPKYEVV